MAKIRQIHVTGVQVAARCMAGVLAGMTKPLHPVYLHNPTQLQESHPSISSVAQQVSQRERKVNQPT